jgi:hypothetical protein
LRSSYTVPNVDFWEDLRTNSSFDEIAASHYSPQGSGARRYWLIDRAANRGAAAEQLPLRPFNAIGE